MGRGGTRSFYPWYAQRHAYFQLHVERASPWHLSRWRLTRIRVKRAADQLRTDRRRSSRFRDFDENAVSRKRGGRDLSHNRCDSRGRVAKRIAFLTFWEGLRDRRWCLFAC